MSVENLTLENLEETLDIAEMAYKESIWGSHPFSREYLKNNLIRIIENGNCFTCLCRKNGKIVGFLLAKLGRFLFGDALLGMECGMYVLPEHRTGIVAHLMCKLFFEWCKANKAEPFMEIYFGEDNEKTYDFLKMQGMVECGRVFRGKK